MATFRYVVADVFTDAALAGNQVAVFTDARNLPEDVLQPLARELNLSETVFVYPAEAGGNIRIRIFTPASELPFAGHPTLGTAFVIAQPMQLETIVIETGMGLVPVRLEREGPRIVFGRMEQPIPTVESFDEAPLLAALGVERSELPVELYDNGMQKRLRRSRERGRGRCALTRPEGARPAAAASRRQLLRGLGDELEDADVRAGRRRGRGSGDRVGGGAARGPSRAPWANRLGRRDPASRRASRSGGRRRSTPARTARRTRSSGSRSAARQSSSRAANSGSRAVGTAARRAGRAATRRRSRTSCRRR